MSSDTNLRSVDYSALTGPIDPAEVAAFEAETSAGGARWIPRQGGPALSPMLIVLCVVAVGFPGIFLIGVVGSGLAGWGWGSTVGFGPACVSAIAFALYFIIPSVRAPRRGFGWQDFYRMSRFAWDNGLDFEPEAANPKYPGVMFTTASGLVIVYNHFTSKTGQFFDLGNLRFGRPGTNDTGLTESTHRGFLAVHLGGNLPHIILDAKANDGFMGGIGTQFADQPTVSLEGDFNRHFTLYCPVGYERDALYILTPDLMVDLLDESLAFDVELIGEWLFVYAMKPFDSTDPALYERLFRIVETVGSRAARRSTNYRDDQYSSPTSFAAKSAGPRMSVKVPTSFLVLGLALLGSLMWIAPGLGIGSLLL